jgi:hypothetical protein
MLTTAADLRDHLRIKRREARYDRIMGNPPKQWPTPNYVRMLEIRLARAGEQEGAAIKAARDESILRNKRRNIHAGDSD